MINKLTEGDFEIICDRNCGTVKEYWTDNNWNELMKQANRDGWKFTNQKGMWIHVCKNCYITENQHKILGRAV